MKSTSFFELGSSKIKAILYDFSKQERDLYAEWLIKRLQDLLDNGDYAQVYQQLSDIATLFQELKNKGRTDVITQFSKYLCDERLLPIGSILESRYYCCQKAYALAMTYSPQKYTVFLREHKVKYADDHMFLHRMENIKRDYDRQLKD